VLNLGDNVAALAGAYLLVEMNVDSIHKIARLAYLMAPDA
jgi:hypothetical protein